MRYLLVLLTVSAGVGAVYFGVQKAGWLKLSSGPKPWEVPGLSMVQRLEGIEQARPKVYGPTPEDFRRRPELLDGGNHVSLEFQHNFALALMKRGEFDGAVERLQTLIARLKANDEIGGELGQKARYSLVAAYLRSSEVENCLDNHNYDSCLLPISGGGIHKHKHGASAAREAVIELLADHPDDVLGRWLINIVAMALGEYPQGVPGDYLIVPEVFASEVGFPRFYDVAPELGLAVDAISGSSIFEDFDLDGDLDLVCSAMGLDDDLRYFENGGDGTFHDKTDHVGFRGITGGLNINQADYDDDGDADVLVLRGAWMGAMGRMPNSLLRNEGDGRFSDVTEEAGLLAFFPTQTGTWADFDNDGLLDLFTGSESRERGARLYQNRGDGTFAEVIADSGIEPIGFVKGACWGDYDNDGLSDLYVSCNGMRNVLYRNLGEGKFEDVTHAAGLDEDPGTFACWFFDYDNDGNQDLYVSGYSARFASTNGAVLSDIPSARLGLDTKRDVFPRLYRNLGNGRFENVASKVGLDRVVLTMGANFGDVDNDGWLDIYCGTGHTNYLALMANRLFKNQGGDRFVDVTTNAGMGHLQKGHGITFADVDNDGDQDVYAVMGGWYPADNFPNALYANPGNENHWITLQLEGTKSTKTAVGARIHVRISTPAGERSIHRTVDTGGSFGSNSLQQEIGLDAAAEILFVEVFWPASGIRQVFNGLQRNHFWRITEGREEAERLDLRAFPIAPAGGAHTHHHHHEG